MMLSRMQPKIVAVTCIGLNVSRSPHSEESLHFPPDPSERRKLVSACLPLTRFRVSPICGAAPGGAQPGLQKLLLDSSTRLLLLLNLLGKLNPRVFGLSPILSRRLAHLSREA